MNTRHLIISMMVLWNLSVEVFCNEIVLSVFAVLL